MEPISLFTKHHGPENNAESQKYYNENYERFSRQCKKVYDLMRKGKKLNTMEAPYKYRIGDLRRRVKDLRDLWGVPVKSKWNSGIGCKEYYL